MKTKRNIALVIGLIAGLLGSCTLPHKSAIENSVPVSEAVALTVTAQEMTAHRAAHTATRLEDGTVLLTGGFADGENALASAERYDPQAQQFAPTAAMSVARQSHTATLLPDGKVLIAGGFNGNYLASAELYDPATGQFSVVDSMQTGRSGHVAVLLESGQVLLAGGVGPGWTFLSSAELYDPVTSTFRATGEMAQSRESHTATRLLDGQVLIVGGHQGRRANLQLFASAERYDPKTGTFAAAGEMNIKRHKHDATRLADGRVLVTGGADERDSRGVYASTEIYDPSTGKFRLAATMNVARYKHTGTSLLLDNGHVLLVGGANKTEIYDPQLDRFNVVTQGVKVQRLFGAATQLDGGKILLTGGYGMNVAASAQSWIIGVKQGG